MQKPLADTFWSRLKQLCSGLIFYNTIYWRRASDGLNPPRMTAAERKKNAPPKDLTVIKPRERPRARIDEVKRREMLAELAELRRKMPGSVASNKGPVALPASTVAAASASLGLAERPAVAPPVPKMGLSGGSHRSPPPAISVVKRRRKRRASRQLDEPSRPGFVARLLAKWTR